jgi:hypothetical protein
MQLTIIKLITSVLIIVLKNYQVKMAEFIYFSKKKYFHNHVLSLPLLSITWSLKRVPSSPVLNTDLQEYFSPPLFMTKFHHPFCSIMWSAFVRYHPAPQPHLQPTVHCRIIYGLWNSPKRHLPEDCNCNVYWNTGILQYSMWHFPNTKSNIFYLWFHLMTLATPQTVYMEVLESSHISSSKLACKML